MEKWKSNILNPFITVFVAPFFLCGILCQNQKDYEEVDFSKRMMPKTIEKSEGKKCQTIRMAIASIVSAQESYSLYNQLTHYIGQKVQHPVKTTYCKKYRDVYNLFENDQIDMAFVCTALYIIGKRKDLFELLAVPVVNGQATYQAYIIVPRSSLVKRFEELVEKSFAFTDELSLTGYFYPLYRLKKSTGQQKWESFLMTGSHDNSIQLVDEGRVDGASVDGLVYDDIQRRYPGRIQNVRIIEKSEAFGIPPVVASATCDPECLRKLKWAFVNMDSDSVGQEILHAIGIQKYELPNENLYTAVSKIVPKNIRP